MVNKTKRKKQKPKTNLFDSIICWRFSLTLFVAVAVAISQNQQMKQKTRCEKRLTIKKRVKYAQATPWQKERERESEWQREKEKTNWSGMATAVDCVRGHQLVGLASWVDQSFVMPPSVVCGQELYGRNNNK